jgi:predicted AlkP superfamily phosphohydrolase/phosphomutase
VLGNPLRTVYAALDDAIGRLLARVPGANVLIASDHGFGGVGTTALRLNRWLAEQGYLAFAPRRRGARIAGALRSAAVRAVPERWQAPCFRAAGGRLVSRLESGVRFGGIDWRGTRAFSEELNYFPAVWLNVAGRDADGTVAVSDYASLCDEITGRLLDWRDPLHGGAVVRRVWQRDELYSGPYVSFAPDLVMELAAPGGYSYVGLPSYGEPGGAIAAMRPTELGGGKLAGMSGSHRSDGLFVVTGDAVRTGAVAGAQIADMAPSVLSLCGVTPPADWDGRTLDVVGGGCVDRAGDGENAVAEIAYDDATERDLQRRLEQLGYLA